MRSHRITDSTQANTGTIPKLGDENRQFARDDRGLMTINWEGYINNYDRMEWNGTPNPGDVMVISKDGTVSINGF